MRQRIYIYDFKNNYPNIFLPHNFLDIFVRSVSTFYNLFAMGWKIVFLESLA